MGLEEKKMAVEKGAFIRSRQPRGSDLSEGNTLLKCSPSQLLYLLYMTAGRRIHRAVRVKPAGVSGTSG